MVISSESQHTYSEMSSLGCSYSVLPLPIYAAHELILSSFAFEMDNQLSAKVGLHSYVSHRRRGTCRGAPRVRAARCGRPSYPRQPPYANAIRQVAPDGVDSST